ncbi:phospholipase A2-like [Xiphophorus couchianus]|uniref:phospholipase A2-like n=1 Tax=Xiphophorus couchianus TaxID=32473 RepID=UPI001017043A|nr:phospholipase A2-like [Xiphophorus couchianus]
MSVKALLLLLTACVVSGGRLPMALWQFGEMISCAQPGVNPLAYNEYGCWCGLGGSGTPVDDVDRCCEAHDKCYKNSRKIPGCEGVFDLPYIIIYGFSCSNRQVYCSAANEKCEAAVCECDRVAAHCFARHTYDPDNKHLDPQLCVS